MARGRPREFDEEQALAKAAQLFRERGYEPTSTQALSEVMGMGEQSIYNAFGSKEKVFQRALDQYCLEVERSFQMLASPTASLEAIESCFSMVVNVLGRAGPFCLVAQTCIRFDEVDQVSMRRASKCMRNIEKSFLNAVKNAVDRGELFCDNPRTVARFLNMTVQGLSVLARSGTPKNALRTIADMSLQTLR